MRRNDREITDIVTIEKIIEKADVCRIAMADMNIPYMVTMNFGYCAGNEPRFYFHCANEGRKLDMIRKNNFVCFSLDTDHEIYKGQKGCDWGMNFSSVTGNGIISVVTDKADKKAGLNCIMKHYSGKSEHTYEDSVFGRTTVLRLDIKEMTCKKG